MFKVRVFGVPALSPWPGVVDLRNLCVHSAAGEPAGAVPGLEPTLKAGGNSPTTSNPKDRPGRWVLNQRRPGKGLIDHSAACFGTQRTVTIEFHRGFIHPREGVGVDEDHNLRPHSFSVCSPLPGAHLSAIRSARRSKPTSVTRARGRFGLVGAGFPAGSRDLTMCHRPARCRTMTGWGHPAAGRGLVGYGCSVLRTYFPAISKSCGRKPSIKQQRTQDVSPQLVHGTLVPCCFLAAGCYRECRVDGQAVFCGKKG